MSEPRFVGITVQEALDIAYESDSDTEVAEVFIEPPQSHVLSDKDSADEDNGGCADNLNSRQLSAAAEIRFANSRRIGGIADDLRLDNIGHYIVPIPDDKRRRCAGEDCNSRGRTMCCKCDVGLCVNCFKKYHTTK
ncbi:hypothetical protein ABEB36_000073 [Hypothenemus hampei]|uniref:Uncharacterized protein n=1 Tax=Hypothenemus hampei TaxID=57062 RepID=A0ABD1FA59_HYPHA